MVEQILLYKTPRKWLVTCEMGEESTPNTIYVIAAHGPERYNLQVTASEGNDVLVSDLKEAAHQVTGVPTGAQKIIFRGKQLSDLRKPLSAYGVKNGSKLMVMGNKPQRQKDSRLLEIEAVDKKVTKVVEKQTEIQEELGGIEQGYLNQDLIHEALQKLERRLASCHEEFLKLLETLDSLSLGDGPDSLRTKRKSTVQKIQRFLDANDEMKGRITELASR